MRARWEDKWEFSEWALVALAKTCKYFVRSASAEMPVATHVGTWPRKGKEPVTSYEPAGPDAIETPPTTTTMAISASRLCRWFAPPSCVHVAQTFTDPDLGSIRACRGTGTFSDALTMAGRAPCGRLMPDPVLLS